MKITNLYVGELGEDYMKLTEDELKIFDVLTDMDNYDFDLAVSVITDGQYFIYEGCTSMEDVARQYKEQRAASDYKAVATAMTLQGNFIKLDDNSFIEVPY